MYALLALLFVFSLLYVIKKIIDAYVLPIFYCINGDRELDEVEFTSYIPYKSNEKM